MAFVEIDIDYAFTPSPEILRKSSLILRTGLRIGPLEKDRDVKHKTGVRQLIMKPINCPQTN